jgi:hypothetical protein
VNTYFRAHIPPKFPEKIDFFISRGLMKKKMLSKEGACIAPQLFKIFLKFKKGKTK